MPTRLIPLITSHYYHIFNRGINKQPIFLGSIDYQRAVELLKFYQYTRLPVRYSHYRALSLDDQEKLWQRIKNNPRVVGVTAYCFMPNHYHFLLHQQTDKGISQFISNWQNSYSRYFNTKHGRFGPLFQGQFKAVRIEDNRQLLHLSRYIHLNPYTDFIVNDLSALANYHWSSLGRYLDKQKNDELCQISGVIEQFKNTESYRRFVFDQADYQRQLGGIKHLLIE